MENALTPTFTSTPLLPPLPRFLADLLHPGLAEANETQREINELEATQIASQATEEPVIAMDFHSPLWMEGKEEIKKIIPYRPGYRPELSVHYIRDKSRDVPEAEKPRGLTSYTLDDIPAHDFPEPKIPASEMPRITTLSLD